MKKISEISYQNIKKFLKSDFTLRELFFKFLKYYILNKICMIIKYPTSSYSFLTFIDCSAILDGAKKIKIGKYSTIKENAWLIVPIHENPISRHKNLVIGENVSIGGKSVISAANQVVIENNVLISPNVTIVDHAHDYVKKNTPIVDQSIKINQTILIKEGAWIGSNAVIASTEKEEIIIGKGSVIAANSVVKKSIPDYVIVAGNPAKIVKKICHY